MIDDRVSEDLHLDYKDSRALSEGKFAEVTKDVSAFANSDGGLLVYGIREKNNAPVDLDLGVPRLSCSRERLENVINSGISRRIPDVEIVEIPWTDDSSYYAVGIPKSYRAPHQAQTKRFYKRYNFQSAPMEYYEIEDVSLRGKLAPPSIQVRLEPQGFMFDVVVENTGSSTVRNISFEFSKGFTWPRSNEIPRPLVQGIQVLGPKARLCFTYGGPELFADDMKQARTFSVSATYRHPITDHVLTDLFEFDLDMFSGSRMVKTDVMAHAEKTGESLKNIHRELKALSATIKTFAREVAHPSGLQLSVSSLRGLGWAVGAERGFPKIDPRFQEYGLFCEVLGVDRDLGMTLYQHFHDDYPDWNIRKIEGITEEIASYSRPISGARTLQGSRRGRAGRSLVCGEKRGKNGGKNGTGSISETWLVSC